MPGISPGIDPVTLSWSWPPGSRAWCVSDCTDDEHSWRGWVTVLWHRGDRTYVMAEDRSRALWIDWTRGHLFRSAPQWWPWLDVPHDETGKSAGLEED